MTSKNAYKNVMLVNWSVGLQHNKSKVVYSGPEYKIDISSCQIYCDSFAQSLTDVFTSVNALEQLDNLPFV